MKLSDVIVGGLFVFCGVSMYLTNKGDSKKNNGGSLLGLYS